MGLVEESFFSYRTVQALLEYGTPQGGGALVKEHPTQRNKDTRGRFEVHHVHRGFLVPRYFGSTSEHVTENRTGAPRVADAPIGAPRYTIALLYPLVRNRTPAELV